MANKQNFKPDEWSKILQSTMLAGIAVTAADPSGLWGALKEAFASSSALAAAKSNTSSSELIKAVIADFETKEGRASIQEALRQHLAGAKPADAVQRSLANLREVSQFSMPTRRKTPLVLRHGCGLSARTLRRPLQKVAFSASEDQSQRSRKGYFRRNIEGSRHERLGLPLPHDAAPCQAPQT